MKEALLKKPNLTYEMAVEMAAIQSEKRCEDLKAMRISVYDSVEAQGVPSAGAHSSAGEPMEVNAVQEGREVNAVVERKLHCYRCGGGATCTINVDSYQLAVGLARR